jgi:hypothetical protein
VHILFGNWDLASFDVKASVIQPGNYNSEISKTSRARRGELTEKQKNSPMPITMFAD